MAKLVPPKLKTPQRIASPWGPGPEERPAAGELAFLNPDFVERDCQQRSPNGQYSKNAANLANYENKFDHGIFLPLTARQLNLRTCDGKSRLVSAAADIDNMRINTYAANSPRRHGDRPMQRRTLLAIAAYAGWLSAHVAVAEESGPTQNLMPANFNDGGRSLQNLIRFPGVKRDVSVSILCGARLDLNGEILDNYCWDLSTDKMGFINAIHRVAKQARLTPAAVDGTTRPVWFQYSVEFEKRDELEHIAIYPNWGFNREQYGPNYIGPQLYNAPRNAMTCGINRMFTVVMNIDSDAGISDPKILSGNPNSQCVSQFLNFAAHANYIPAHADVKPVSVQHVDIWFNSVPRWTGRRRRD